MCYAIYHRFSCAEGADADEGTDVDLSPLDDGKDKDIFCGGGWGDDEMVKTMMCGSDSDILDP